MASTALAQARDWLQAAIRRLRAGDYFPGCERCGKFEQNVVWSERVRARVGDDAWRALVGAGRPVRRLRVVS